MTGTTLFFTVVGVGYVAAKLMQFIVWLDTPKGGHRHDA